LARRVSEVDEQRWPLETGVERRNLAVGQRFWGEHRHWRALLERGAERHRAMENAETAR
jgi:hypothetical protein